MIERVHHIDFVVRDLEAAAVRFARLLGRQAGPRERLADRGVELVRFEVGNVWLILVQPVRQDSPVQAFLDKHGEGFFHIAFAVGRVAAEAERLLAEGIDLVDEHPRRGVEGWQLLDVAPDESLPVCTQLVQDDAP